MKGHILDFSIQSNMGVISADDGTRYTFAGQEWKEARTPQRNMRVDFDLSTDQQAVGVYLALGQALDRNTASDRNTAPNYTNAKDEANYHLFDWFMKCIRNYANFSGRARRKEFWFYNLSIVVFAIIAQLLDMLFETGFVFYGILILATLIPGIAASSRRLHDIGRSGWWYLIAIIPIVGIILLIVWWAKEGEANDNAYGAATK